MEKQIEFYKEQIEKCRVKALEFRSKNDTKMYFFTWMPAVAIVLS